MLYVYLFLALSTAGGGGGGLGLGQGGRPPQIDRKPIKIGSDSIRDKLAVTIKGKFDGHLGCASGQSKKSANVGSGFRAIPVGGTLNVPQLE